MTEQNSPHHSVSTNQHSPLHLCDMATIGTRSYLPTPLAILLHCTYYTVRPLPRSSALLFADGVTGILVVNWSSMLQVGGFQAALCPLSWSSRQCCWSSCAKGKVWE
jgi:hypothetical protein